VTLQLFELLEDKELFTHLRSQNGVYTPEAHIAEMIALFGPPPQKLIDQERKWRDVPWERLFPSPDGNWCDAAREYYGGPFFDSKGITKVETGIIRPYSNLYDRLFRPSSDHSNKSQAR